MIRNIGDQISSFKQTVVTKVKSGPSLPLIWPNTVTQISSELFGEPGVLVAGGFCKGLIIEFSFLSDQCLLARAMAVSGMELIDQMAPFLI